MVNVLASPYRSRTHAFLAPAVKHGARGRSERAFNVVSTNRSGIVSDCLLHVRSHLHPDISEGPMPSGLLLLLPSARNLYGVRRCVWQPALRVEQANIVSTGITNAY